jgi:regulator of sirC expression with transglutaminase-like and TPR domain
MGRYDFAIADYTKALSLEPRDAGLLIDRGKILAKVGSDHEAITDFTHALVDHNAIIAFRERGLVYKKLGDISAALADLTWFTRFEPKDQEVLQGVEEMQAALSPRQAEPQPSRPPETNRAEQQGNQIPSSRRLRRDRFDL